MVKFSKQFEGQIVPEWKEAFVDYCQLKKDLKKIHLLNPENAPNKNHDSSLSNTLFSSIRNFSSFGHRHREHGVIQVLYFYILIYSFPLYIYVFCTWFLSMS